MLVAACAAAAEPSPEWGLAAFTDPGQAPAQAPAALGVQRPLEIADVGTDGDA